MRLRKKFLAEAEALRHVELLVPADLITPSGPGQIFCNFSHAVQWGNFMKKTRFLPIFANANKLHTG